MKFIDFRKSAGDRPTFDESFILLMNRQTEHKSKHIVQVIRNQLSGWQKKRYIIRLKKGLYTLAEDERTHPVNPLVVSSELMSPSYVSLEWALSYYGLIPEAAYVITCVTTRKTHLFQTPLGHFSYRHVQPHFFDGFVQQKDGNKWTYRLAIPEKAIVDFLYLNLDMIKVGDSRSFEENFRFQHLDTLNWDLVNRFLNQAGIKKLSLIGHLLQSWAETEGKYHEI